MITLVRLLMVLGAILVACEEEEPPDLSGIDLPQTITATDNNIGTTLTVRYPDGWEAQPRGGVVILANDPDVLNIVSATDDSAQIAAGQVYLDVMALPRTLLEDNMRLPANATATDVLRTLFVNNQPDAEFSDIRVVALDGRDAVSVTATRTESVQPGRVQFYVLTQDEGFVAMSAYTVSDEESFDETIRAMAEFAAASFSTPDIPAESATEEMTPEATSP